MPSLGGCLTEGSTEHREASSGISPEALDGPATQRRIDRFEPIRLGRYVFRQARTAAELAAVHQLNYRTFVRELPQHADPGGERLVDKFHDRNVYFVALHDDLVVGMISGHSHPPFSIADKLEDPSILDSLGTRPFEVRLLAVEPAHRHRSVVTGLMWAIFRYVRARDFTHILISGVAARVGMYEKLGFQSIGPGVICGEVEYVPMTCDMRRMHERVEEVESRLERRSRRSADTSAPIEEREVVAVSMMPGSAHASKSVSEALARPMISHRGPEFAGIFATIRERLAGLTGKQAALFVGSGTLANDVIGQTLAADGSLRHGLILSNGEFGGRLVHQARRMGLSFSELSWEWGRPWDLETVEEALDRDGRVDWIWGVHLETSTGMLNDVARLVSLSKPRGVRVSLDCVSALGAVPVDLRDVHLASGVSNKSLGAVAGVSIVFGDLVALDGVDRTRVPAYLDLFETLSSPTPRFTFPSPQVQALLVSLDELATPEARVATFTRYAELGRLVRLELRSLLLLPLVDDEHAAPVVTTFHPPTGLEPDAFLGRCLDWGYQLGGESGYLRQRNLLQLATMGAVTEDDCRSLFDRLHSWLGQERSDHPSHAGQPDPEPEPGFLRVRGRDSV